MLHFALLVKQITDLISCLFTDKERQTLTQWGFSNTDWFVTYKLA